MDNLGSITNPAINKLLQMIKNANDNEIVLFDEQKQSFSSRSIYAHIALEFVKKLCCKLAVFLNTSKFNNLLEELDAKLYLAEAAAFYLKKININDHYQQELTQSNKNKYMIKEIKNAIVRIKNSNLSINKNKKNIITSIFTRTIKNTYFNFDFYKEDYNTYCNKIKKYISFIFTENTNLELKEAKSIESNVIKFFNTKSLEITNNKELKAFFKRECLRNIGDFSNNVRFDFNKLSVFNKSSLLPIILEICVEKQISICDYLNTISNENIKYWDDHLALQKIIESMTKNTNENKLNTKHFANLLLIALNNIEYSGINPVLNLLYSNINNRISLTDTKSKNLFKLFELLVRSNKKEKSAHIKYILKYFNHLEDDYYKDQILFFSVSYDNDKDLVSELINKGANVNMQTPTKTKDTLLIIAIREQKNDIIKEIIKNRADLNIKNISGYTALSYAVFTNSLDIVKLLLKNYADVNAQSITGDTALIDSVFVNNLDIAKELIKNGADLNSQNIEGDTALIKAAKLNRLDIIKQLIQSNADLNLQSNNGDTALMKSVFRNNLEIIKILISKGADINFKNKEGKTALIVAKDSNNQDILNVLSIKNN